LLGEKADDVYFFVQLKFRDSM